jgi:hypothetical protein
MVTVCRSLLRAVPVHQPAEANDFTVLRAERCQHFVDAIAYKIATVKYAEFMSFDIKNMFLPSSAGRRVLSSVFEESATAAGADALQLQLCERLYLTCRHIIRRIGVGDYFYDLLRGLVSDGLIYKSSYSLPIAAICYFTQGQHHQSLTNPKNVQSASTSTPGYTRNNFEAVRAYTNWCLLQNFLEIFMLEYISTDGQIDLLKLSNLVTIASDPSNPQQFDVSVTATSGSVDKWNVDVLLSFLCVLIYRAINSWSPQDSNDLARPSTAESSFFMRPQSEAVKQFINSLLDSPPQHLFFNRVELEQVAVRWLPYVLYVSYILSLENLLDSKMSSSAR